MGANTKQVRKAIRQACTEVGAVVLNSWTDKGKWQQGLASDADRYVVFEVLNISLAIDVVVRARAILRAQGYNNDIWARDNPGFITAKATLA